MASLGHIQIASFTAFVHWSHYKVKAACPVLLGQRISKTANK